VITGRLELFDHHLNLVLRDVHEEFVVEPPEGEADGTFAVWRARHVAQMLLRGDSVLSVSAMPAGKMPQAAKEMFLQRGGDAARRTRQRVHEQPGCDDDQADREANTPTIRCPSGTAPVHAHDAAVWMAAVMQAGEGAPAQSWHTGLPTIRHPPQHMRSFASRASQRTQAITGAVQTSGNQPASPEGYGFKCMAAPGEEDEPADEQEDEEVDEEGEEGEEEEEVEEVDEEAEEAGEAGGG